MTSIPSKLGLILIAVYWTTMVGLTTYALTNPTNINRSVTETPCKK